MWWEKLDPLKNAKSNDFLSMENSMEKLKFSSEIYKEMKTTASLVKIASTQKKMKLYHISHSVASSGKIFFGEVFSSS